jgi:L-asparaginase
MIKRILFLITGGTIAGNVAPNAVTQIVSHGSERFLSELQGAITVIKENWAIEIQPSVRTLFNVDSTDMQPHHWTEMAAAIEDSYDQFEAFVILHGTNTMGYSAAALTFAFENINKPVIFTGAQVPLGYLGSDATTNLINALRLAVWQYHQIKGVYAVFGSKIISGPRVKKGTDFDYDPFSAFQKGSIGQIGRFIRITEPALEKYVGYLSRVKPLAIQSRGLSVKKQFDVSSIASLTEFPGMSPDIFKVLVEHKGTKAFIFRAFGAGDSSSALFDAYRYLREHKIPIVVTTQAPTGVANFAVNDGGMYLKDNDLAIPAHDMSIEAMTTKLAWLLAQKLEYESVKVSMINDLHGEIVVESELL